MFLVKDKSDDREKRIAQTFEVDPPLGMILAVVHFEWTVKRAILKLGKSSPKQLRKTFEKVYQWDNYAKLWKEEVVPKHKNRLPQLISNENYLQNDAWTLRHKLVHGAESCSKKFAQPKFDAFMNAAKNIRDFVKDRGLNIDARLQTRKVK